jgi:hypothetical protein
MPSVRSDTGIFLSIDSALARKDCAALLESESIFFGLLYHCAFLCLRMASIGKGGINKTTL